MNPAVTPKQPDVLSSFVHSRRCKNTAVCCAGQARTTIGCVLFALASTIFGNSGFLPLHLAFAANLKRSVQQYESRRKLHRSDGTRWLRKSRYKPMPQVARSQQQFQPKLCGFLRNLWTNSRSRGFALNRPKKLRDCQVRQSRVCYLESLNRSTKRGQFFYRAN